MHYKTDDDGGRWVPVLERVVPDNPERQGVPIGQAYPVGGKTSDDGDGYEVLPLGYYLAPFTPDDAGLQRAEDAQAAMNRLRQASEEETMLDGLRALGDLARVVFRPNYTGATIAQRILPHLTLANMESLMEAMSGAPVPTRVARDAGEGVRPTRPAA